MGNRFMVKPIIQSSQLNIMEPPAELNKPMYMQIQEYLAELILSGKLPPDSKIQSEREISEELGVSRMTARKALTELVTEGLLIRKQGSGTYVAHPRITYESKELINHVRALHERNMNAASQILEFSETIASRRLAELLEVEIGHTLYRIIVLRYANRVPMVVERMYFSCARCPNLEEWDFEKTSVMDLLHNVYGVKIGVVSQTVEAVVASETIAKQLHVEEGFPLLRLSRVLYTADNHKPVQYSQDFLRSDYARIRTEFVIEDQDV